jgi:4-amino-4-deoxy-L-arabinose transferase-like glycosyltransferase
LRNEALTSPLCGARFTIASGIARRGVGVGQIERVQSGSDGCERVSICPALQAEALYVRGKSLSGGNQVHWPQIDLSSRGVIALACCLILTPLWVTCLFGRGLWTPDEPREAAISQSMSWQAERSLPQFAGQPFLEKPPLTYWMAGAAISAFPHHDAALRAPNLLYATVATLAMALLGFAAGGRAAAWIAGLASSSSLLALQVASWLATDAAMMSGVTLALLGFYRGLESSTSRARLLWYALMHAGLAIAFMAKGPAAWLVPVLAAAGLLAVERNWRELLRWEIWIGLAIPGVVIASWLVAVARSTGGEHALSVMLWQNVAGRVMTLQNADAIAYSRGHRNWLGKYFVELPLYLLPWTLLFVAAVRRAWRSVRDPHSRAWRFAACALVLPIIPLSLAGTARGIYAAPLIPPAALLIGLWAKDALAQPDPFDRRMIVGTMWVVAALALILFASAGLIVSADPAATALWPVALAGIAAAGIAVAMAWQNARLRAWPRTLAATFAAFVLTVISTAVAVFPAMDRWQDLMSLARAVECDTRARPLAIFAADETIIAVIDRTLGAGHPAILQADSVADGRALLAHADRTAFLVRLKGSGDGAVLQRLRGLGVKISTPALTPPVRELIDALDLSIEKLYELPQGRRYALLSLQQENQGTAPPRQCLPETS